MKLLDKIKDLFMEEEEEYEDVELEEEEKEEYKEPKKDVLPKVMRETIKKEEKKEEKIERVEQKLEPEDFIKEFELETKDKEEESEEKIPETPRRKFNFPIDFDDEFTSSKEVNKKVEIKEKSDDFTDYSNTFHKNVNVLDINREVPKKVSELYQEKKEEIVKPKFKASPVISPVYGVLDKNYTKEEVKERTDDNTTMKRPSKKVDFETVRKKAFGNLADEIKDNLLCENCELYKEVKKISSLREDDLLYDMTVEEDKDVTIEKAYDNYEEFGVAYEPKVASRKKVYQEEPEVEVKQEEVDDSFSKIISNIDEKLEQKEKPIEQEEVKDDLLDLVDDAPEDTEVTDTKASEIPMDLEIPSREDKNKDAKVDDDFFELIDSMYKERVDE